MKKIYYFIAISLTFCCLELQAHDNEPKIITEKSSGNFIEKKDLDPELVVYLHDKAGTPIQCTHPEKNGNFLFTELVDGKYCITVLNVNGYKSEHYCVNSINGQIYKNLSDVLKAENLIPAESSFENYSCETKSDLNLSILPSPLKNKGDLQFSLKHQASVQLVISNEKGDKVRMIPVGELKPGIHSVGFDTTGLKGTYQVAAQSGKQQSTCTIEVK